MRYSKYLYCGLLAISLAVSPVAAHAQTAGSPLSGTVSAPETTTGDTEVLIKEDLFTVSPALETELSNDNAVPVQLQFNAQPNTTEAVDISGITAEGFTRKVSVNGDDIPVDLLD